MRFLSPPSLSIMFGGLLLVATTLGYYYCTPIGSDDELTKTRRINPPSRSIEVTEAPAPEEDAPQSVNHFCERLYAGQFADLRIQSFSARRTQIRMYESGNLYKILRSTVDKHKVQLPEQYTKFSLDKTLGSYKPDDLRLADVVSIYDIRLGNKDTYYPTYYVRSEMAAWFFLESWASIRRPLILLTSAGEYIWNLVFPRSWFGVIPKGTILSTKVRDRPDYALVFRQDKEEISGYVINQDIYGSSSNFIIYDLFMSWNTLQPNVQFRDATPEDKESAPYYYIQKTDNPSEALLVHRKNYHKVDDKFDRQLFHTLPRGFVHQFNADFRVFIYLFDSDLGCVYVLEDLGRLAGQYNYSQNLTVKRINIPYEDFFTCPTRYRAYMEVNASRCNTTIHELKNSELFSTDTLVKVCIVLIVVLNVAFAYFLCYVKQYYKKVTFFNSKSEGSVSKKAGSPGKDAGSVSKKVGSVYKNAGSPSKKAGSVSKKARSPSKKAGSPSKKAGSVSKKAASPSSLYSSLAQSLASASKRSPKPSMTSSSSPTNTPTSQASTKQ